MQAGKGAPKEEVLDSIEALYRVVKTDHIQQWLDGPFLELDPHERLEKLHTQLQQNGSDAFDPISLLTILPMRLSSRAFLNDLKPSKARLDLLDKNCTIFLDSAEERTVAALLYHYGFISDFVQGKNYHVPTQGRISLDFLLENHKVFIEYHPLSHGNIREGITLQQAGQRKIDSINQGRFKDYKVYHISRLDELWGVLNEVGFESPPTVDQFSETKQKSSEHRSLILAI
jgi:ribosomal protein S8